MNIRRYPQFILLGDSIIQYSSYLRDGFSFTACLEEHCTRRLQVINLGLSGYNTDNALKIFEHLIPDPSSAQVSYLLILFGANDACLSTSPTKQHVPLEKYKDNIKTILTHPLVKAQQPTILLVTPPPVNEVQLEEIDGPDLTRKQGTTTQYAEAVREIAEELKDHQIILVDLWQALIEKGVQLSSSKIDKSVIGTKNAGDDTGIRKLLTDGLHLTSEGYKVFWETLKPLVGHEWSREPEKAPSWVFPHWSQAPKD